VTDPRRRAQPPVFAAVALLTMTVGACTSPGQVQPDSSRQSAVSVPAIQSASASPSPSVAPSVGPASDGVIVYLRGQEGTPGARLRSVRPDGGGERTLVDDGLCCFALSRDGARLIVELDIERAATLDIDGSGFQLLGRPDPALFAEFFLWAPSGERILFHGWKNDDPATGGIFSVRSTDGGDLARVAKGPGGPVAFSPGGKKLMYVLERATHDGPILEGDLFVANADGSHPIRVNPESAPVPIEPSDGPPAAWSPDSTRIAYTAFDAPGSRAIYIAKPDGSERRRVPNVRDIAQDVEWSPDGSWLAFATGTGINTKVEVVRPDGSDRHVVTSTPLGSCCPVWSPDSTRLLVAGLSIVQADGSGTITQPRSDVGRFAYVWTP